MTTLRELLGKPVVSRGSAETLGTLAGAVIDPARARIVAWQVGKGRKARLVELAHIIGIADAVMVDNETSVRKPTSSREQGTVKGSLAILGHRALSDAGDDLGTVEDVTVDTESGTLIDLRTSATEAAGQAIRGFGSYALILGAPG